MLWTVCVILIILWLLGLITGTTMGGFVHVLLVIAIIVVLCGSSRDENPYDRASRSLHKSAL